LGQFFRFATSFSTSSGGSSTTCIPGKSGKSLISWGSVLYAHWTISSKLSEFVDPGM
jgi:hypothetical protein